MQLNLAFDKNGLLIDLPPGYQYLILSAKSALPLPCAEEAVATAINEPLAGPPLAHLAQSKKTVAIAICDITRPIPNHLILPAILQQLQQAGIDKHHISILLATGLHRPSTAGEIPLLVGEEIARSYTIFNHHARQREEHAFLGHTVSGIPVFIDRRFIEADLHLTVGFIEPHLMLGFSGGRKLIAPGLAAAETIKAIHSPKFMREPLAVEGSIEQNPLHKELLEIARLARHDFMVDVALTCDRRIAAVFAGHPEEAHRHGVDFIKKVMLEELSEPVDAVITTAAGYPLDLTFYQAVKGVTAASHIVKPGGKILLCAACAEGAGSTEFTDLLVRFKNPEDCLEYLGRSPVEIDQWQLEKLALVHQRAELVFYVPGLRSEHHRSLWGTSYATVALALQALTQALPRGARIAVLPEGPYVLAKLKTL